MSHFVGIAAEPDERVRLGADDATLSRRPTKTASTATTDNPVAEEHAYQDLLLNTQFLLPFVVLTSVTLIAFAFIRPMCVHDVPNNCKLFETSQVIQQLLACIERIFLVVALSDFAFLFPRDCLTRAPTILYACLMLFVSLMASIIVSAGLTNTSIRAGTSALRILVAIILILVLLPPLFYNIVVHYTPRRRYKALAIFIIYFTFLIAFASLHLLHIHHWTWSFLFLILHYPPTGLTPSDGGDASSSKHQSFVHRYLIIWSHVAQMIALGILIEGLSAYGNQYYFISSPATTTDSNPE